MQFIHIKTYDVNSNTAHPFVIDSFAVLCNVFVQRIIDLSSDGTKAPVMVIMTEVSGGIRKKQAGGGGVE